MATAITVPGVGTTAALMLGEPALAWAKKATASMFKDHPQVVDWATSILTGASYGFGALTLASSLTPSLALLPAMAYGAAGGAILAAAWKTIKAVDSYLERYALYRKAKAKAAQP